MSVEDVREGSLYTNIVVRNPLQLLQPPLQPQQHAAVLVAWVHAVEFVVGTLAVVGIAAADGKRCDCNMEPYQYQGNRSL